MTLAGFSQRGSFYIYNFYLFTIIVIGYQYFSQFLAMYPYFVCIFWSLFLILIVKQGQYVMLRYDVDI